MKLSKSWRWGGALYALGVLVSVVLRLWQPAALSGQITAVIVTVSNFCTLPPYFAGIGLYPGMLLAGAVQDWTGLSDSHPLPTATAWSVVVLGAITVAIIDVLLAHTAWRFVQGGCRSICHRQGPSAA